MLAKALAGLSNFLDAIVVEVESQKAAIVLTEEQLNESRSLLMKQIDLMQNLPNQTRNQLGQVNKKVSYIFLQIRFIFVAFQ